MARLEENRIKVQENPVTGLLYVTIPKKLAKIENLSKGTIVRFRRSGNGIMMEKEELNFF